MRHALGFAKRWIGGLLLISITGWAGATDVRFVGPVGYSHLGTVLVLDADQIRSYAAAGTSASLRMELWATPSAVHGFLRGRLSVGRVWGQPAGGRRVRPERELGRTEMERTAERPVVRDDGPD